MYLVLGNDDALDPYRDPLSEDPERLRFKRLEGDYETKFSFPDGTTLDDAMRGVIASMPRHMSRGSRPVWVESDSVELEQLAMAHFGVSRGARGRPVSWGVIDAIEPMLLGLQLAVVLFGTQLLLRHRAGRDWMCRIMGDPNANGVSNYAAATWMGFSAEATAPAFDDLVLAGEITEGTLGRTQGIYSHTNGTAAYTLTKTVTFDQAITLLKMGLFLGPTGGQPMFSTLLDNSDPGVPGDRTQMTYTATL